MDMKTDSIFRVQEGAFLESGEVVVSGEAGPYAGREMRDGLLHIKGSAGAFACASMQGGIAVIDGDAGTCLGHSMRRGVIVVYGKAGGDVLPEMRGGTVILAGGIAPDARLLEGMNRGTVILPDESFVPHYFEKAADTDLVFLRFLFRQLLEKGIRIPGEWLDIPFTRWRGDMVSLGKGEILTPAGPRS